MSSREHCVLNFPYENYKKIVHQNTSIKSQSHDIFRLGEGYENTSVNVLDRIISFCHIHCVTTSKSIT